MSLPDRFDRLAANLGDNLRAARQQRNLTQRQLAELAEIPRSTVANIETGGGNPTLSVLTHLASALQLSLEELLSPPRAECQLFPRGSLPIIQRGRGAKAVIQKLLPDSIPSMEFDRIQLEPKARLTGAPHRAGTREYLFCEKGRLELWVSGEPFQLEPGDVAAFPGDQAHSYHNRGSSSSVGLSVVLIRPS